LTCKKTVGCITCIVLVQTLNHAQPTMLTDVSHAVTPWETRI